jgi:tetratricopeptide (TPR) repeat protein
VRITVFLLVTFIFNLVSAQNDPQFFFNKGTDLALNRDFKAAIESFDEAIRLDPNLYYVYASRGAAKAEMGNYKAALADYNAYQKIVAELNLLGDSEILNKKAQVEKMLEAVVQKEPGDGDPKTEVDINKARNLYKLNEAIESNEESRIVFYRGKIKYESAEYAAAVQDLTQAITLDSGFLDAWITRGYARLKLLDLLGAFADFDRALMMDPLDYKALVGRGEVKDKQRNYISAADDFTAAIAILPSSHVAYFDRGLAWFHQKAFDKAQDDFSTVIKLFPTHQRAYFNRGLTRFNLRQRSEACFDFKAAADLGHAQAQEYYNRFCK